MAKKTIKKPRIARTRNAGTMTESMFWSMLRSALRQKSRWWKPIGECKKLAQRAPFVDTLFCEQENLQVLCKTCHDQKTQLEKQLKQFKKKKT